MSMTIIRSPIQAPREVHRSDSLGVSLHKCGHLRSFYFFSDVHFYGQQRFGSIPF